MFAWRHGAGVVQLGTLRRIPGLANGRTTSHALSGHNTIKLLTLVTPVPKVTDFTQVAGFYNWRPPRLALIKLPHARTLNPLWWIQQDFIIRVSVSLRFWYHTIVQFWRGISNNSFTARNAWHVLYLGDRQACRFYKFQSHISNFCPGL